MPCPELPVAPSIVLWPTSTSTAVGERPLFEKSPFTASSQNNALASAASGAQHITAAASSGNRNRPLIPHPRPEGVALEICATPSLIFIVYCTPAISVDPPTS